MLQQLFHIIVLSIVCVIWGIPVIMIFYPSIKKDAFWYHSATGLFCFLFICGCALISILSSIIYLLAPLKFTYLAIATVVLSFYLGLAQKQKIVILFSENRRPGSRVPALSLAFAIVSIALFVLLSALQPANGDTQIYHLQIIRWQTEYSVVPGIANLYPRLGLGSNWFNLISFFYWPAFKNENFTYFNAAFVTWFFIWLISKWHFYFQRQQKNPNTSFLSFFYFLIVLYCMFDWQLFRDSANSTNYDFAVNVFTIIISSFFIEGVFINKPRNHFSLITWLFALCAISFKLSGIFLLLLVFYHMLISRKTIRWPVVISVGLIILLPVLAKNYFITGYPLFPSTITLNTPDWMVPKKLAAGFYRYIILSNRFYNHQWSFANKIEPAPFNWVPYWFSGILWKHKIMVALSLSSGFFLFKKTKLQIDHRQLRLIILSLLLMLLGWFLTAPDPGRFGYGILLSASFLPIGLFISRFMKTGVYILALFITTITMTIYGIRKSKPIINKPRYAIQPIPFRDPPYQIIRMDSIDLKFPYPVNNNWDCRCYFLSLPCVTQKNSFLQPRGDDLKDGFRMNPQPDSSYISNYIY